MSQAGEAVSPTDRWLESVAEVMPPLSGPEGVAERLLLLLHYGVAWSQGWVTARRGTYWDELLPDRVVAATYRAATLPRWWTDVSQWLESRPRSAAERLELEQLLRTDDPVRVLEVLRSETAALVLRVRIVSEAVRAARDAEGEPADEGADRG